MHPRKCRIWTFRCFLFLFLFVCFLFFSAIELSLFRFTDSDYPFGIFKLFFYLAMLRRPLVLYRKYLTKCFLFVSIDIVYVVMTQGWNEIVNTRWFIKKWNLFPFIVCFLWRFTNAVNFNLLLDKRMWLHPIKKGIFNIKLGYYTCKGKVVITAYIIWAYCCGFEGSLLPWYYVIMIYI